MDKPGEFFKLDGVTGKRPGIVKEPGLFFRDH